MGNEDTACLVGALVGILGGFALCMLTVVKTASVTEEQMNTAVETCSANGGVKSLYIGKFVCANGLKGEY